MKIFFTLLVVSILLLSLSMSTSRASEVDLLIDKLVEKGILTPKEADELLKETKKEAEKEKATVIDEATEKITQGKTGVTMVALPEWAQKMKFKGDFRLRYELKERQGQADRHRGRYRLRFGVETDIVDNVKVGFGLASGSNDPRSTNQTFADSFDSPDIRLDYAYATYTPFSWLELTVGKIKNPLWCPSDLLWDSDIRPEGVAALLTWKPYAALEMFCNSAFWILDERSGDENDPTMFVVQPGVKWSIADSMSLQFAAAYYGFNNVQGTTLDHSSETNTLLNGGLKYDYDSWGVSAELGAKQPFSCGLPYLALFSEYINNTDSGDADEGYLFGVKLGDKKIKEHGQWQFVYMYRRLERDAWLDIFPDSDFYGGATNSKGHEIILGYGLTKNVTFNIDYYITKNIRVKKRNEDLLQVDMNFKF